MIFEVIPNFTWLPWYLQLLIIFPIALFIVISLAKFIITLVDVILKIKGIWIR